MTHYAPTPGQSAVDLMRRLTAACTLAGVTAPTVAADVSALLDHEPTVRDVETALALEVLDAPDPHAFTADALERMARAQAAQAVREGLARMEQRTLNTAAPQLVAATIKATNGAVTATIKALVKAAKELPQTDPLDLGQVIATDTTAAMKTATKALADLAVYRNIHGQCRTQQGPRLSAVLPLVDLPKVETERLNRLNGRSLSAPSPAREAVRSFARAVEEDYDAALIALARGEYEGCTLTFATTSDELRERVARADRALIAERVDSWEGDSGRVSLTA